MSRSATDLPSAEDLRHHWQDEADAAYLYRVLAEAEPDAHKREIGLVDARPDLHRRLVDHLQHRGTGPHLVAFLDVGRAITFPGHLWHDEAVEG